MKTEGLKITPKLNPGIQKNGSRTRLIKALNDLGLETILVDPESSFVELDSPKDSAKLLEAVALKAKSYLSCAIGKMS